MSHGLSDHFSRFIPRNGTVSLKIISVYALNHAGLSQLRHRAVSPAVGRHVGKGIGSTGTRHAHCQDTGRRHSD